MKPPETMTRDELIEYIRNQKNMIRTLQVTLTKALDTIVRIEKEKLTASDAMHC